MASVGNTQSNLTKDLLRPVKSYINRKFLIAAILLIIAAPALTQAQWTYWSLFNKEGETELGAQYVTYATFEDMLNDVNRVGVFDPDGTFAFSQANLVGSGSDGNHYWSLFNKEGETELGAQYVTYATFEDMLNDVNRVGVFDPDGTFAFSQANLVGSGSDGNHYWSLFNKEGETELGAQYVTYATFEDMLNDVNRVGVFDPDGTFAFSQANLVGSGSDGNHYWSLFNKEGETELGAQYVTYATFEDMLNDVNRVGVFDPDGTFFFSQANLVGSGAIYQAVPEPKQLVGLMAVFAVVLYGSRRRRAKACRFIKP